MSVRYAGDLDVLDVFSLAGQHYTVHHIYETDDEEMVKFRFYSRHDPSLRPGILTVPRNMLFNTV